MLSAKARLSGARAAAWMADTAEQEGKSNERGMSKYVNMQKNWYEKAASLSRYDVNRKEDNVVGSYNEHNNWPDYDKYLLGFVDETWKEKLALDFACGPGRNIVKFSHLFKRLDGRRYCTKQSGQCQVKLGIS